MSKNFEAKFVTARLTAMLMSTACTPDYGLCRFKCQGILHEYTD